MIKNLDVELFGAELKNILERFYLPSNDIYFKIRISTHIFDSISITWEHFSQVKEDTHIPKIDFSIFDEQIYLLLKSYYCEIKNYGLTIGIPYQIFDAYVKNFPDELTNLETIEKTGNRKEVSWYYVILRRESLLNKRYDQTS